MLHRTCRSNRTLNWTDFTITYWCNHSSHLVLLCGLWIFFWFVVPTVLIRGHSPWHLRQTKHIIKPTWQSLPAEPLQVLTRLWLLLYTTACQFMQPVKTDVVLWCAESRADEKKKEKGIKLMRCHNSVLLDSCGKCDSVAPWITHTYKICSCVWCSLLFRKGDLALFLENCTVFFQLTHRQIIDSSFPCLWV